ncbi:thiamine pyrophosphate-dependent enzyme [Actinoplanes sp. DH11]|uniref:thiamine pyrophosphate-dependent enzyme n=1 Tax=Actinoplanes sp. DH11 TaxID=2857011 RepID=UPI001E62FB43|nr:thiamine pyrophosphate-dependent enzyme [Actinoplanes sp. DH11]
MTGHPLLPTDAPVSLLDTAETAIDGELAVELYRRMVLARRFNRQATALTLQGRLSVYPSSAGQEAVAAAVTLALAEEDWLFPTYRDTAAVVLRGVDPVQAVTLLRGDWHHGWDPGAHRVAPLATPLATQTAHAVGLAHAAALAGDDLAVLALIGDGGTSEGDFHEAVNLAAVFRSPVVFLVQNNGYAISVPLSRQSAAPSLAHKGIGYGVPGVLVDGNDALAVHRVVDEALTRARRGGGPSLIEARTYRIDPHTNADDATRYRADEEVAEARRRDPLPRLERHLRERGLLDDATVRAASVAAEALAAVLRDRLADEPRPDPADLFTHVYATTPPHVAEQRRVLTGEAGR